MKRRNIIIAIAGLAVVVVLALVLLSGGTEVTEAAEQFLSLAASGQTNQAYDSTDLTLQAAMDKATFARAVKELKINSYKSVHWTKHDKVEEEASLVGTMTLKDGTSAPVELTLLQTEDTWRVSDLHWQGSGSGLGFKSAAPPMKPSEPERPALPSKPELRVLSTETILKLDEAIKKQDFNDFYNNYISKEYRKQVDPHQLQETFYSFYTEKIDLSDVKKYAPVFDNEPAVDARGYFIFTGHYPTYPPTNFNITYVFEDGEWKVFYLRVTR